MKPYTQEEWDLDPSEGRGNATRMRLTIDALFAHIDAEPARIAAGREEQRAADARACLACKGDGFVMRVRECPFCNDATCDHECPTDRLKVSCGWCNAAQIRATPLTATPLADKIAALRADLDHERRTNEALLARAERAEARAEELKDEVARRDALIRSDGYEEMRQHAQELAVRAEKAEARVKELEVEIDDLINFSIG